MADPYVELAREVTHQPDVMQGLADWFDSGQAKSAFQFGRALGEMDSAAVVAAAVASWLEAARCPDVVAGYLAGLANRDGDLPEEWQRRLDQVAERHGEYAALVTVQADRSLPGFHRILGLATAGTLKPRYLRGFALEPWAAVLGPQEKSAVLGLLLNAPEGEPPSPLATALDLAAAWTRNGRETLADELVPQAVELVRRSLQVRVDPGHWLILTRLLAPSHPEVIADVVMDALTATWPLRVAVEDEAIEILVDLAKSHPRLVMEAIGRKILDPRRRGWFGLFRCPGLFEAIGVETIREWIQTNGREHVKEIAQHLDSPSVQNGQPWVPPVTHWLFTEHEGDEVAFRRFCAGRHAMEVRHGGACDRRAELEKALEPFRNHPLRRVRDWVAYELHENDEEARIDELMDERRERM